MLSFSPEKVENKNKRKTSSENQFPQGQIGVVEKGSLEEAMWRDLGALPRSRGY